MIARSYNITKKLKILIR